MARRYEAKEVRGTGCISRLRVKYIVVRKIWIFQFTIWESEPLLVFDNEDLEIAQATRNNARRIVRHLSK